jgi:hypothetical protein
MQTWVNVQKGYSIRTRKSEQVRILACVRYVHVEKQPEIATEEASAADCQPEFVATSSRNA